MLRWWGLDAAAYALSRIQWLDRPCTPIDQDDVERWIATTQLSWAPGSTRISQDFPWDRLMSFGTDEELAAHLLRTAAAEGLQAREKTVSLRQDTVGLAARRRLPLSLLLQFSDEAKFELASFELDDELSAGCADGHVHQAASLPLDVLIHWIAGGITSIGFKTDADRRPSWTAVDGETFRPEPLLFLLQRVTTDPKADVQRLSKLAYAASCNQATDSWTELREMAQETRTLRLAHLPELVAAKQSLLAAAPERWLVAVRVEAILHNALSLESGGLDLFVKLFEDLRSLRSEFTRHADRREFLGHAIQHHAAETPGLVGLELRSGEPALTGTRTEDSRTLCNGIVAAVEALQRYLESGGRAMKVTFPISLVKTTARPSENWRFDARGLYRVVEDLILVLQERPQLAAFVDGLDTAGLETEAPTWLFTPAYERFAEWASQRGMSTSFRFHAGESFLQPLTGVRSIDEFLSMPLCAGVKRRVGHALALESTDWSRLPDQPILECLDDMVWAWRTSRTSSPNEDLEASLQRAVVELAPLVFGDDGERVVNSDSTMETLWRAYCDRTNVDVLRDIGFLSRADDGTLSFLDGTPTPGKQAERRLTSRALSNDAAQPLASLGRQAADLKPLLMEAFTSGRDYVRGRLRATRSIIETCPTSNILIGEVRGYRNHPIKFFVQAGIDVTVNSDDPALFHAFLRDELARVSPYVGTELAAVIQRGREVVGEALHLDTIFDTAVSAISG